MEGLSHTSEALNPSQPQNPISMLIKSQILALHPEMLAHEFTTSPRPQQRPTPDAISFSALLADWAEACGNERGLELLGIWDWEFRDSRVVQGPT